MAQLSNREKAELRHLLKDRIDQIEARLEKNKNNVAEIKADLNKVRNELMAILGLQSSAERNGPLMVAGGDSEGKVTYVYPTGDSEDY